MKRNFIALAIIALFANSAWAAYDATYEVKSSTTDIVNITTAGNYLIQGDFTQAANTYINVAENLGTVNLTINSVKIYPGSSIEKEALLINAGTHVNLTVEGTNHLQGKSSHCGITVLGSLTINAAGSTDKVDSLYTQGSNAPGIGGLGGQSIGDITINSGTVVCRGTTDAAGLGIGQGGGTLHNIIINGGKVTCWGTDSNNGSGIGCGSAGSFNKIEINGGMVTATGRNSGCGIGATSGTNGDSIVINGGTVTATGGGSYNGIGGSSTFTGKIIITGGSVNATCSAPPVNAADTELAVIEGTLDGVSTATAITSGTVSGTSYNVVLGTDYHINDVYTDASGKVWFWLPTAPSDVEVILNTSILNPANAMNITTAGNYTVKSDGTQTSNQIVIAGGLGDVMLTLQDVNICCTGELSAMIIGAGSNVTLYLKGDNRLYGKTSKSGIETSGNLIFNNGSLICEGAGTAAGISGSGKVTINGGTFAIKGTPSIATATIEINGGSIKTMNAEGTVSTLTGVKNASSQDVALFACTFTGVSKATLIKNGSITGTGYSIKLKNDYGITDVYTDAAGNLWFYLPAPIAADATASFNTMETIDLATVSENLVISEAGTYLLQGNSTRWAYQVIVNENIDGEVNIILDNVDIKPTTSGCAVIINSGSEVNFTLQGNNTLQGRGDKAAAIQVIGNVTFDGEGTLTAKCGGNYAAGIGGINDSGNTVGNITINGGTITATGGACGAGIGGAQNVNAGDIVVNGGFVTATGGNYSAGIGGAYISQCNSVTINGGTVITKGEGEYALGGSPSKSNCPVTINGGSIKTLKSDGTVISASHPVPVNTAGTALTLFQCSLSGVSEATAITSGSIGSIVLGTDYGINDVITEADGSLYFYLPTQEEGVSVKLNTGVTTTNETKVSTATVFVRNNNIVISNMHNKQMIISDMAGHILINQVLTDDYATFVLPQGMYLLKIAGENTYKIAVR